MKGSAPCSIKYLAAKPCLQQNISTCQVLNIGFIDGYASHGACMMHKICLVHCGVTILQMKSILRQTDMKVAQKPHVVRHTKLSKRTKLCSVSKSLFFDTSPTALMCA